MKISCKKLKTREIITNLLYCKYILYNISILSLDTTKLKKMIDYCLKEPKNTNISLNIEHINISSEKIDTYFENSNLYKTGYKYPYICSEVLSSDLQIILDKLIPISDVTNLEESKSYLLNLSSDSNNNSNNFTKKEELGDYILLIDEIKREPNFLFNPPEIEYGYDKEKEEEKDEKEEKEELVPSKIEKEKEANISKDRDISFNTSIDRKFTLSNFDVFDTIDYILSFITLNELNSIQASYLAKIISSIIRSTKCCFFIRYICFRKPEILISILNNVHLSGVCDILVKLLLIDSIVVEESLNYDSVKVLILNRLVSKFTCNSDEIIYSNISFLLIEYIENAKNLDIVLSDAFINSLTVAFGNIKNKIAFNEILNFCIVLLKQFKFEYEKAYKFVSSISIKSKILEKTNILTLESDIIIINKFSNSLDTLLEIFTYSTDLDRTGNTGNTCNNEICSVLCLSTSNTFGIIKTTITELISVFLSLSRNHLIIDKFDQFKFFNAIWTYFFLYPNNNIFHNHVERIFNILVEESNTDDTLLESFLIKSNFLPEAKKYISCNNNNDISNMFNMYNLFPNGKKVFKGYYVQIAKICHVVYSNTNSEKSGVNNTNSVKKMFSKNGNEKFMEEFISFYETHIQSYVEKMNHALGNYKNNQQNILSMLENNEEFCSKKFDLMIQIQDMNTNLDNLDIDNNRELDEDFADGDGEFLNLENNNLSEIILNQEENKYFDNNYWKANADVNMDGILKYDYIE